MPDHNGRTLVETPETIRALLDELIESQRQRGQKIGLLLRTVMDSAKDATQLLEEP